MAFRHPKIILILFQIAAFSSVWRWYYSRVFDASDEFYGILALIAIAVISFKSRGKSLADSNFTLIAASVAVYAISFPFLPPLLRAAVAVTSLTFTISGWQFGRKFHFGIWSLFLLSLPIVASMQFYLGFPLRVIVGETTAFLLKLNGLAVFREGACLHFGEQLIWIDAPCSGVKMLWAGFFLTALLVTVYNFRPFKSVLAFIIAFGILLSGNIFRASGLFYLEAGIVKMPGFAHEAIGIAAFILTCAGIAAAILKLKKSRIAESTSHTDKSENSFSLNQLQVSIFALICLAAFTVSFLPIGKENPKVAQNNVKFPDRFENEPLRQLDLSEREKFFLQDFPGEIKRFTQNGREIIIRYVTEPTRKLHPASDCFSAIGYRIAPLPLKIDESAQKWSCFSAVKNNENLKVCERIYSENGENWTDVSSWYWSALSNENQKYWALTTAEINE